VGPGNGASAGQAEYRGRPAVRVYGRVAAEDWQDPGMGLNRGREYERAFYGNQCALMAPLFEHYGIQLWIWKTVWSTPGILEAVKPGRMQGHGGTEEVPQGHVVKADVSVSKSSWPGSLPGPIQSVWRVKFPGAALQRMPSFTQRLSSPVSPRW
jgi:hypothetical protein